MIEELLAPLVSERFRTDERYRNGHIRIINALPGRRIIGVHTPEMKALAKKLSSREDCRDLVSAFAAEAASGRDKLSQEEMNVWGFMINRIKCPLEERLSMMDEYVPQIDNWAVCDMFVGSAKWIKKTGAKEMLWKRLRKLFASRNEFEVRFAVVACMSYYLDKQWLDKVFDCIDEIDFDNIRSEYVAASGARKQRPSMETGIAPGTPPYYVRMGVAWFLATALARFPDDTRTYLQHSRLPQDVLKLYVRKARESFRTKNISPFSTFQA